MRLPVLIVLVAGTLAWSGTASAAPYPSGYLCGFDAVEDRVEATLLLTDDTLVAPLYTGSVTCLVRVDGVVQEITGPTMVGVATASGTVAVDAGADLSLCTRVDLDGWQRLYYDGSTWVSAAACPWWMPVVV